MLIKRYRGRVVKHMRRGPTGIVLTFISVKDQPGDKLVVTQAQWEKFGSEVFEEGKRLNDFRTQARGTTAA